jgi:hypothetical protein
MEWRNRLDAGDDNTLLFRGARILVSSKTRPQLRQESGPRHAAQEPNPRCSRASLRRNLSDDEGHAVADVLSRIDCEHRPGRATAVGAAHSGIK